MTRGLRSGWSPWTHSWLILESFQPTARAPCPSTPRIRPEPQQSSLQRLLAGGAPGAGAGGPRMGQLGRLPPGLHPQTEAAPPEGSCTPIRRLHHSPRRKPEQRPAAGQGVWTDRAALSPCPGGRPTVTTDGRAPRPALLLHPGTETPRGPQVRRYTVCWSSPEHHRVPEVRPCPTSRVWAVSGSELLPQVK